MFKPFHVYSSSSCNQNYQLLNLTTHAIRALLAFETWKKVQIGLFQTVSNQTFVSIYVAKILFDNRSFFPANMPWRLQWQRNNTKYQCQNAKSNINIFCARVWTHRGQIICEFLCWSLQITSLEYMILASLVVIITRVQGYLPLILQFLLKLLWFLASYEGKLMSSLK